MAHLKRDCITNLFSLRLTVTIHNSLAFIIVSNVKWLIKSRFFGGRTGETIQKHKVEQFVYLHSLLMMSAFGQLPQSKVKNKVA